MRRLGIDTLGTLALSAILMGVAIAQVKPGGSGAPAGSPTAPANAAPAQTGMKPAPAAAPNSPAAVIAPAPVPGAKGSADTPSAADRSFIMEAASGGLAEVELGQLAKENGQSEQVKQFGQHMIDDHGKANMELSGLAGAKGMTLPNAPAAKHKALKDRLAKLTGAAFDKQYMREMVKDHENDVAAFKRESTGGKDADVTGWAKKTLPTLEQHLTMAREAEAQVKKGQGAH